MEMIEFILLVCIENLFYIIYDFIDSNLFRCELCSVSAQHVCMAHFSADTQCALHNWCQDEMTKIPDQNVFTIIGNIS